MCEGLVQGLGVDGLAEQHGGTRALRSVEPVRAFTGYSDDFRVRVQRLQRLDELHPVYTRHLKIGNDDPDVLPQVFLESLLAIRGKMDLGHPWRER